MSKTFKIVSFLFVAIIATGMAIYLCFTKSSNNEESTQKEKVASGPAEAGQRKTESDRGTQEVQPGSGESDSIGA